MRSLGLLVSGALALLVVAPPAAAAVVTVPLDVDFAAAPYTFSFGGGASVTFTLVDGSFFAFDPAGISTTGTAHVLSLGPPFYDPPRPTSFFSDRGGSIGPATLGTFASYATPAAIPFSIVDSIVGLRFDLGQGFQYGYAQLAGSFLSGIRYETTPGVGVDISAVPEPATWGLLIGGFALVGTSLRRRRALAAA